MPPEPELEHANDRRSSNIDSFGRLTTSQDRLEFFAAFTTIERTWQPGYAVMILESIPFIRGEAFREAAVEVLERQSGQQFGGDLNAWYRWIWLQEYAPHPKFPKFKAALYSRLDHPETRVLSLDMGHRRDDGEGVAYHDYFATDELMFGVPKLDKRLRNKAKVLAIRLDGISEERLAISVEFLDANRVYQDRLGETEFVVVTNDSGANRVYESQGFQFVDLLASGRVSAKDGSEWEVTESSLDEVGGNRRLSRLPSHRAFWFGWHAAFPTTRLVK